MRNKIITVAVAALAVLAMALPVTAEPGDPDHPGTPVVGLAYDNDVDRLAAEALAAANIDDGIETVATTTAGATPQTAQGRYFLENVQCWIAVGSAASTQWADATNALRAQGADRFESARMAGDLLNECNPS